MGALTTVQALKLKIKGAIRSAIEAVATVVDTNTTSIGTLSTLTTTTKTSAVAAINELDGELNVAKTVTAITDNTPLTAAQSGGIFTVGVDAKVITLPATVAGVKYTIINSGAAGNNIVTISPNASDKIMGTFTLAASVVVLPGTDNKDIINTKSSSQLGDFVTLVGDGAAGWYVVASAGIWASE